MHWEDIRNCLLDMEEQDKIPYFDVSSENSLYIHIDLGEFHSVWFSKNDYNSMYMDWTNPNNGDKNTVPINVNNIEEFRLIIKNFLQ